MNCRLLFDRDGPRIPLDGRAIDGTRVDHLDSLAESLKAGRQRLFETPFADLIGLCDAAASLWTRPGHPLAEVIRRHDLGFLPLWMRRDNLRQICERSLRGRPEALDSFVQLKDSDPILVRAQPRGLAAHWLAGNVPVLGFISLLLSFLCKNANLLKVARNSAGLLPQLIEGFRDVTYTAADGRRVSGQIMIDSTAVVYAERADHAAATAISMLADVRIAWGGREVVEAVMHLPRRIHAEDVIFGPMVSLAAVGAERLANDELAETTAMALARDAAAFDQHGCNSPHTVFVERGGAVSPQAFAKLLARTMETVCRQKPPGAIDPAALMNVLAIQAEYDMRAEAYYDQNARWTVLYADEDRGLADPCGWRTLFVRPIDNLFEVAQFCSNHTQTVGLAADARRTALADAFTARGVARCPNIGNMRLFDAPWDGMFLMDRLVRWTSTY